MHTGGLTLKVTVSPGELLPAFSADGALCAGESEEPNRVPAAGRLDASCLEDKEDKKSQPI